MSTKAKAPAQKRSKNAGKTKPGNVGNDVPQQKIGASKAAKAKVAKSSASKKSGATSNSKPSKFPSGQLVVCCLPSRVGRWTVQSDTGGDVVSIARPGFIPVDVPRNSLTLP